MISQYSTEPSGKYSYGPGRKEPFGKLFVAIFAAALYFSVFIEGIQKLFEKPDDPKPDIEYILELLIFGGLGITLNVISCLLIEVNLECTFESEQMGQDYWVLKFSRELLTQVNNFSGSLLIVANGLLNLVLMGRLRWTVFDGLTGILIVCLQCIVIRRICEYMTGCLDDLMSNNFFLLYTSKNQCKSPAAVCTKTFGS